MIDSPNYNRNLDQLNQTNPTMTDCWKINAEIKMIQARLKNLLQQFVLLQQEKEPEKHSFPYFSRLRLTQEINMEAANLIVAWESLKESVPHLLSENDIENNFAKDIKDIRADMNSILQKIDMVTI